MVVRRLNCITLLQVSAFAWSVFYFFVPASVAMKFFRVHAGLLVFQGIQVVMVRGTWMMKECYGSCDTNHGDTNDEGVLWFVGHEPWTVLWFVRHEPSTFIDLIK